MNTKQLVLLTAGLAGLALSLQAAAPSSSSRVEVEFVEPENFTDLKDSDFRRGKVNEAYLSELKQHLERTAERRLPAGHRLVVAIEDVDMAGDFEPWRSPELHDVRIVRDIYPPRIDLSFRLYDSSGSEVAEGKRELRDLAFNMRVTMQPRSDPLRHEKALLEDWVRREFRPAKKSR